MARKVTIVCDITGEEGASPYLFGYEGKIRSIDITDEVREYFEELMEEYVAAAQIVGTMEKVASQTIQDRRPVARGDAGRHTEEEIRACRQWAENVGLDLPDGRIAVDVWTAFRANDVTRLKRGRMTEAAIEQIIARQNGKVPHPAG